MLVKICEYNFILNNKNIKYEDVLRSIEIKLKRN